MRSIELSPSFALRCCFCVCSCSRLKIAYCRLKLRGRWGSGQEGDFFQGERWSDEDQISRGNVRKVRKSETNSPERKRCPSKTVFSLIIYQDESDPRRQTLSLGRISWRPEALRSRSGTTRGRRSERGAKAEGRGRNVKQAGPPHKRPEAAWALRSPEEPAWNDPRPSVSERSARGERKLGVGNKAIG